MECNRDEAIMAKLIAEDLFKVGDITGAKKFALKAQHLFSNLEGLSQLLGVVNIYYAHEHTIKGEVDYYGILGVDPSADEEIIRKQYKRLALLVHPDKNKLSRDGKAFMILLEAWRVLSNEDERRTYDMKLNLKDPNQTESFNSTTHATHPPPFTPASAPSQSFSFSHHQRNMPYGIHFQFPSTHQWIPPAETTASSQYTPPQKPRYPTQQSSTRSPPPTPQHQKTPTTTSTAQFVPASRPTFRYSHFKKHSKSNSCSSKPETFWTGCDRCRIKYEFLKILLDQEIQCPRCQQSFLAIAMPAPSAKKQEQDPVVASGGTTQRSPQAARDQPSTQHAERGSDNLGTTSSPCTVSGGFHTEKPVKRRRKDGQTCVGAKESQGAAEHSRVILLEKAKQDILNQLNKWKNAESV